jgi:transketolase
MTPARFEAYGWQVIRDVDGHDPVEIQQAIETARAGKGRPTLICCRTIIGFGAPNKQGTEATHGAPLGADEVAAARQALGWHHPAFEIPERIMAGWDARERGALAEAEWHKRFAAYRDGIPSLLLNTGVVCLGICQRVEAQSRKLLQPCNRVEAMLRPQVFAVGPEAFGPLLPE